MDSAPPPPVPAPVPGTVVVTRPRDRAADMVAAFEAHGVRVLHLPTIEIVPPGDPAPLRAAVARLADFDWVVFTSANAVRAVEREGAGAPPRRVAAVGRATADAVATLLGWRVDLVPERFTVEGLLDAFDAFDAGIEGFGDGGLEGASVFLPLADRARDVLSHGLARRGVRVERAVAYRTVSPDEAVVAPVRAAVEEGEVDLLTFTSPSTAENLLELLGEAALGVPAAVIGPVTGEAAEGLGYRVAAVASDHTADGLVAATVQWLRDAPRRTREPRPEAWA